MSLRVLSLPLPLTRRSFFALSVAAIASAVAVTGCQKKTDDIPVGAYLSLTGPDSTFGTETKNGFELAAEQLNAAGGIKGKKVRVIYEDDKSVPTEATQKVQQLIDREGAVAILGEVASSRSLAGGLVANNKKVPMITPSSTAVEVTKGRDYVFRTCFTDAQQGDAAAQFVRDTLKKGNVGILYAAQDTYSSGLANRFKETFEKLGGKIVVTKGFQKGETNFTTYLKEVKAANPELIFVPVYFNEIEKIARQGEDIGIQGSMFMGGDGWDGLEPDALHKLQGAYMTNHYASDAPWEHAKKFIADYKAKFHQDPTGLAAQGYDSARLLFDAMMRATDIKPDAIKDAIAATKEFQGATGKISIDKEHNAAKPVVVVQIRDKALHYYSEAKLP